MRDSSSGPISEIVARTGWPWAPNTSQNTAGKFVGLVVEAEILGALDQRLLGLADRGNARQVALDVGGENRDAGARQAFGENLQGDGLAGAGCAGDQPVTVGKGQRQQRGFLALADEYRAVGVDFSHQQAPP